VRLRVLLDLGTNRAVERVENQDGRAGRDVRLPDLSLRDLAEFVSGPFGFQLLSSATISG